MEVTVLLFASLAERAGWRRRTYELREGDTVAAVRDRLVAEHPALGPAVPSLLYAVNEEYVREYDPVPAGATLALIPPVSGGADDADTRDR
jgi:molybdopterin synthase catalytic subunit